MASSRGIEAARAFVRIYAEDQQLKRAYRRRYEEGTRYRSPKFFHQALTSSEIKLKLKSANIAGLQLCDLLAYPSKQEILIEEGRIDNPEDTFSQQICQWIEAKYNRQVYQGRVKGYGKIFLG